MTVIGIDLAWARPSVAEIKATGARFVARYFSRDDDKNLHAAEVQSYPAAGLSIVVVWETTAGRATAGQAAGVADAQAAEQQRKAVGLPADMVLHFAVDKDVSWSTVAPYFEGVISVIGLDRTGCYGGIDVITGAYQRGIRYLWQTVAWSEGRWHPHATIRQTGGTALHGGADWDTATVPDYGQYPRPVTPEDDMPLSADDKTWIQGAIKGALDAARPQYADATWKIRFVSPTATDPKANTRLAGDFLRWGDQHTADIIAAVRAQQVPTLTMAQITAIAAQVAASPALASAIAEQLAEKIAARLQN